uniref:BACK domain-containing protein n=1 Tax=Mesocestoides corti TaxID=53468 RepID=A0A5K3G2P0_MESCO
MHFGLMNICIPVLARHFGDPFLRRALAVTSEEQPLADLFRDSRLNNVDENLKLMLILMWISAPHTPHDERDARTASFEFLLSCIDLRQITPRFLDPTLNDNRFNLPLEYREILLDAWKAAHSSFTCPYSSSSSPTCSADSPE